MALKSDNTIIRYKMHNSAHYLRCAILRYINELNTNVDLCWLFPVGRARRASLLGRRSAGPDDRKKRVVLLLCSAHL